MSMTQEPEQVSPEENKHSTPRFVEELANEQDYWMSLTDAARVTRTSEPMVRRWVTAGRLPVRKEPAGINQRTRLVRASDVAQIRPIIDPTAAITDEVHKLDLLSIPRQQEQIIRDQQRLSELVQTTRLEAEAHIHQIHTSLEQNAAAFQQQVQEWEQRFTGQQTEWQQQVGRYQQRFDGLDALTQQLRSQIAQQAGTLQNLAMQLQQAQIDITNQIATVRATLQEAVQEVQQNLEILEHDLRQQTEQLSQDFLTRLNQQQDQFHHLLEEVKGTLTQYDQAQSQALLAAQQSFQLRHAMLDTRIEKFAETQEQRWNALSANEIAQNEYMKNFTQRLEALEARQPGWQASQVAIQEQQQEIQKLTVLYQDERTERQRLVEQVLQQQEQLHSLSQELERFKTRYSTEPLTD